MMKIIESHWHIGNLSLFVAIAIAGLIYLVTDSEVPELTFGLGGPGQPHPLQPVISALPFDIVSLHVDL